MVILWTDLPQVNFSFFKIMRFAVHAMTALVVHLLNPRSQLKTVNLSLLMLTLTSIIRLKQIAVTICMPHVRLITLFATKISQKADLHKKTGLAGVSKLPDCSYS